MMHWSSCTTIVCYHFLISVLVGVRVGVGLIETLSKVDGHG